MRVFTGQMRSLWLNRAAIAVGIAVCATPGYAAPSALAASAISGSGAVALRHAAIREIEDRCTGDRWLLVPNTAHPGGPGRLVLVAHGASAAVAEQRKEAAESRPVIEAGDAVLLEAHTAVMDAELEATAVAPARVGAEFPVRLKVGGKILRAIALGSGRAKWIAGSGQ